MNKLISQHIRKIVMAGKGEEVKLLLLNKNQISLVELITSKGPDGISASQLSKSKDISLQCASSRLRRLYLAGYINRLDVGANSGGSEYIYYALHCNKEDTNPAIKFDEENPGVRELNASYNGQ